MKNKFVFFFASAIVVSLSVIIPYFYANMDQPENVTIRGEGLNQLDSPNGAVTDDKNVYVVNSKKNTISVFDLEGKFQYPIGKAGENEGELQFPVDVELYGNQLYIADLGNNRIQVFTKEGQFLDLFPRERNIKPAAIAIADDKIYISDVSSQTVKVYTPTGILIQELVGEGDGKLNYANGLTVLENGDVVVSDSQNHRIQLFHGDGTFKGTLSMDEHLAFPKGMALEGEDLLVADALEKAIYRFSLKGEFKEKVGGKIPMEYPTDVSVSKKFIVITDSGNNEVILIRRDG